MKEIPLGGTGFVAVIDDDDFLVVAPHTWTVRHHKGNDYAVESYGCCGGRGRQMHRLILAVDGSMMVDHWDGSGLNNTRTNLRIATNRQNQGNRRKQAGSSRYKGVSLLGYSGRWRAVIKDNGPQRYLGAHDTEEEAARAYDVAARTIFGEFAALNFPEPGERSALHPSSSQPVT